MKGYSARPRPGIPGSPGSAGGRGAAGRAGSASSSARRRRRASAPPGNASGGTSGPSAKDTSLTSYLQVTILNVVTTRGDRHEPRRAVAGTDRKTAPRAGVAGAGGPRAADLRRRGGDLVRELSGGRCAGGRGPGLSPVPAHVRDVP